jgi:hypothetical protein
MNKNILLLGGSNTGIWDGWAHHFVILAERHLGVKVSNRFLGAVGSLYGLFRLLKMEQEKTTIPDLIIFEYMLNDIVLVNGNIISRQLVNDTLDEIAQLCVYRGIALHFLCLQPRGAGRPRRSLFRRGVQESYRQVSHRFGLPVPLFQHEAMGRDILDSDYLDPHHLTPEASRIVAEALLNRLCSSVTHGSAQPPLKMKRAFTFVDATQAIAVGRARLGQCEMTVLQGPVIEMQRPSSTTWPATGRLVGVLFRSRRTSGWYRIQVDRTVRRKNACTSDLSLLPELVVMQYPNIRTHARGAVEIAMPKGESELMSAAHDPSQMPQRPEAPFLNQELAVFGLMFWTGPRGLGRLTEGFDFWRRAVLRGWPLR